MYDSKAIEAKWKERWDDDQIYKTSETSDKPKCYVLDMFPYPSGEGLHVGHPKGYIATDVYSRFQKMSGKEVLHPMGWDAFGLPAENYAIKNKVHPRVAVETNIARYKEQLKSIGFNYDWSREVNTTDPGFYTWTQWIFLKLYEKGLAFESHEPINWCPSCQTGLANEDLEGGTCERCGSVVEKRPMRQWVLRITDYAERLLADLDTLTGWPEHIKESQRNWIGKSEGAEISFEVKGSKARRSITAFTTRPDTLFGATYLVLAPEHPLVSELAEAALNMSEIFSYVQGSKNKPEIERTAEGKEKTGVKIEGVSAVNPANQEEIPVYVADYVLGSYGTGAVMAVPAHDERDHEFAKKFGLSIKHVIEPRFIGESGDGAVRPDLPFVKREAVCAIVRNPKDDTYLCNSWKTFEMRGLFTGGVEEGEDIIEAARREVQEETGYKNLRHISTAPIAINTFFYHRVKQQNRHAHFRFIFFDLENDERDQVKEEESAVHEALWKTREELDDFFTVFEGQFLLNLLDKPDYVHTGEGLMSDSGEFTGMESTEARKKITDSVGGRWVTKYKLRDWVFSRQRYWGEPIPMVHCEKDGVVPVPESQLPVTLPDVEHYEPTGTGESPLAAMSDWVNTTCPKCGGPAKRETNTMPQWAGSSWYYLRYIDPKNDSALVDKEKEAYWSPVDMYVGGAEHATRHLIYARFWHKFLYDIGVVSNVEPFMKLKSVGLILAEDGRKMSKRYGNVVNPDDIVRDFGADALRVYEMFMGPFEQAIAWSTDGLVGGRRFLEKVARLAERTDDEQRTTDDKELETLMHQTIKKVTDDIEAFRMNTAISQLMIYANALGKGETVPQKALEMLVLLLAPFAPFITEELWHQLGHTTSIHLEPWPSFDPDKLLGDEVSIAIQVNGKVRGVISCPQGTPEATVLALARTDEKAAPWIEKGAISRVVYVPDKLMNIVTTPSLSRD